MSIFGKIIDFINGSAPEQPKPEDTPRREETEAVEGKPVDTPDGRYSVMAAEQRFAWHKTLLGLLKELKVRGNDNKLYRNFTIYILRLKGAAYKWNDETFKAELLQELKDAGLAYIGKTSFNIEVVSETEFKRLSGTRTTDELDIQQAGDILLLGTKKESEENRFATAIDKRNFIIKALIRAFRSSTGTDSELMKNLLIQVVKNDDDDDNMTRYDWVGKRFEDDLRRELANAFLDNIGSKSLHIEFCPKSDVTDSHTIVDNQVYYKWCNPERSTEPAGGETKAEYMRGIATISIIEGTGSLAKDSYALDSDEKQTFHIGRGTSSRKGGRFRINDIVINDKETDPELMESNAHVSSAHADIIYRNNQFYLRAAQGGCRASGGSSTKLVRDEQATELRDTALNYPLRDGDIIELGKTVLLTFTTSTAHPSSN